MKFLPLFEKAPRGADPLTTFLPPYQHGEMYLHAVPYMSLIRPGKGLQGALYQGGVNETILLPTNIRYVVSLHPVEYRAHHTIRGYALFDATDSLEQDPDVFVAASEVATTFVSRGDGDVLVHCQAGLNRAGATTALTLMSLDQISADEAIGWLRGYRSPDVLINPAFEAFVRSQSA
jgi:hypothetical protein